MKLCICSLKKYVFKDLLGKNRIWEGKNSNFTVGKPGKHCGI